MLVALTEGVSALVLRVGGAAAELDRLLDGVFVDLVPLVVEAGADYVAAAEALLPLLTDLDEDQRSRLSVDLGADPLTAPLSGRPAPSVADVVATAAKVSGYGGGVCAITVDGPAFHLLGASASGTGRQRRGRGRIPAAARRRWRRCAGCVAADQFPLCRRRRSVHDDREVAGGAPTVGTRRRGGRVSRTPAPPRVHAVTSLPMMSQRDPWVNSCASRWPRSPPASVVPTLCWCSRLMWPSPTASPAPRQSFARRIARNTQLLLLEESHIGRVLDPAGGSFFVEDLTRQLAEQAWQHFRDIESRGGFVEALEFDFVTSSDRRRWPSTAPRTSGTGAPGSPCQRVRRSRGTAAAAKWFGVVGAALRGRVRGTARPLRRLSRKNRVATAGVAAASGTARRAQHPCDVRGQPVGVRRHRGGEPRNRRRYWCRASGFGRRGARPSRCLCGTDARYGTDASGVVDAARQAGVSQIYLAGPEKAVAQADLEARRLPDRQDRRGRRPFLPPDPIGGLAMTATTGNRQQLRRHSTARRAQRGSGHRSGCRRACFGRGGRARLYPGSAGLDHPRAHRRQTGVHRRRPRCRGRRGLSVGQLPRGGAVHPRALSDHVRQPAVDHPPVRRLLHSRRLECLLSTQPGRGTEGAVGRVRPGHPPRLRLRPSARAG